MLKSLTQSKSLTSQDKKTETKNVDNEQVETGTAVQDITEGSPMAKYINAIGKTAVSNGN